VVAALLGALVAASVAVASPPAAAFRHGLLFRIDAPGTPSSWVFGTMHSNDPRVTRIPPAVAHALASSRWLAPEVLLTPAELPDFLAAGQFHDGRRLADYFDEATLARIRSALGRNAPPPDAFARMKPWAVLLLLARPFQQDPAPILDEVLIDEAHGRRMRVMGLELPDEQVASLDTIPAASQVALVRWTLDRRARIAGDHEEATQAWLARDLERLRRLAAAPGRDDPALAPHLAELHKHLVVNRSVQMAHRLYLPLREGRVFVAVGALHLHGSDGLLAMIRAQGYRVTRVY
jgi:uncharacterized protein YbaP (TraB family)